LEVLGREARSPDYTTERRGHARDRRLTAVGRAVRGAVEGAPVRRSFDLTRDLTTLFVCSVSTVLLTRSFLALAGYPQVGGSKFHIAHVLYGGLLLLAACIVLLAFLNPEVKVVAA